MLRGFVPRAASSETGQARPFRGVVSLRSPPGPAQMVTLSNRSPLGECATRKREKAGHPTATTGLQYLQHSQALCFKGAYLEKVR